MIRSNLVDRFFGVLIVLGAAVWALAIYGAWQLLS